MNFKGMDPQAVVDKLALEGVAATIEPSAIAGSPYAYVYIYLTAAEHEGPHIIISDGAEYGDEGILVGRHAHYERSDARDSVYTVASIDKAVSRAAKLCQTEH